MYIKKWGPYTVPALGSLESSVGLGVPDTIVSVGFQNLGMAKKFCVSQAFVMNATQAYLQFVNSSGTSTDCYVHALVDEDNSYERVSWGPYTCPAFTSQWPSSNFTIPAGNSIVSIGFQNLGSAERFYATQAFVVNDTEAFVQVTNYSGSSTQWYGWAVVKRGTAVAGGTEPLKGADPEMVTLPYEGAGPAD
jgi:hypothetical protein